MKPKEATTNTYENRYIRIRGAKTKNLKNIDVDIPYRQLIAITGPSGAGKTSLGFDTLFAEGCQRYIQSFSPNARQFLEKIKKPPVDSIQGILPSIGLDRKARVENPRTRVSTTTDLYVYLKLLFARLGTTYSPISGDIVKRNTIEDVLTYVKQTAKPHDTLMLLAPLHTLSKRTWKETLEIELGKGIARLLHQGKSILIENLLQEENPPPLQDAYIIVDRLKVTAIDENFTQRIADSAKTTFFEGHGTCIVTIGPQEKKIFSDRFEADGLTFPLPTLDLFDFSSSYGSCKQCKGTGTSLGISQEKVIPNQDISIQEGAILPWQNPMVSSWKQALLAQSSQLGVPVTRPYKYLSEAQKKLIWHGNDQYKGVKDFFAWLLTKADKVQYRILYARYHALISCEECLGTGLRKEIQYIKIGGKNIIQLLFMPIDHLYEFMKNLTFPPHQKKVAQILQEEIVTRLFYLKKVGLGYLNLNRKTNTLSGGEYQRARLAKMVGSPLIDIIYVLDDPTAGLHKRNAAQLLDVLIDLKDMGNTIVVVGHEELIMRAACSIIDLGPSSGVNGGQLMFQGDWNALLKADTSSTARYLAGKEKIPLPTQRRPWQHAIVLKGLRKNNLQDIDVTFPLGVFTTVTGISGSGKSTLVDKILYPTIAEEIGISIDPQSRYISLSGDTNQINHIVHMGQNALKKSSRSNVLTYLGAYEYIRKLLAAQPLAVEREYRISHFSFNTPNGRCQECLGEGHIKIDMLFMEDIFLTCETCQGHRFQKEILEITFQGKNIIDILQMTIKESIRFFKDHSFIINKLQPLVRLGLGNLSLGQPSNSFSTGEAQRVRLALYLNQEKMNASTFFIFDEPSTDLHFREIKNIISIFQQLVAQGHTVIAIEHNMDMIKSADWIIDLGPEGGAEGGNVVFTGTPEEMIKVKNNHTAHFLRKKMSADTAPTQIKK
ncbi:MAG: excinuclease ABC subunit UvrA [Bacteroidota bacterium]